MPGESETIDKLIAGNQSLRAAETTKVAGCVPLKSSSAVTVKTTSRVIPKRRMLTKPCGETFADNARVFAEI